MNMVTILDYAKLALYVYKDKKTNKKYLNKYLRAIYPASSFKSAKHENGMYEVIIDNLVQSPAATQNAFYASFFVKVVDQKAIGAIVAIRGTDNKANDIQDAKSWWKDVFSQDNHAFLPRHYVTKSGKFYAKAKRYVNDVLLLTSDKLRATGHSLGGALAALIPTYTCFLASRAITFNAPGIRTMQGVNNFPSRVINIRATYDFVSSIGLPVGPQINIEIPNEEAKERA